jgi:hypothetical protein
LKLLGKYCIKTHVLDFEGTSMSSFIFVSPGSDPAYGLPLVDPVLRLGAKASMGTCRPDFRRHVRLGDKIFVVSGKIKGKEIQQYIIGAIEVDKIYADQLEAMADFPDNRLRFDGTGQKSGNIIALPDGTQHPRDKHSNFDSRIRNFLSGDCLINLESSKEVSLARQRTLPILSDVFSRPTAQNITQAIGRGKKLSDELASQLHQRLVDLQREARR